MAEWKENVQFKFSNPYIWNKILWNKFFLQTDLHFFFFLALYRFWALPRSLFSMSLLSYIWKNILIYIVAHFHEIEPVCTVSVHGSSMLLESVMLFCKIFRHSKAPKAQMCVFVSAEVMSTVAVADSKHSSKGQRRGCFYSSLGRSLPPWSSHFTLKPTHPLTFSFPPRFLPITSAFCCWVCRGMSQDSLWAPTDSFVYCVAEWRWKSLCVRVCA